MTLFSVLLLLFCMVFCCAKESQVIVGSARHILCPFGSDTKQFKVPSVKDDASLDITLGDLHIPEVRFEHSGLILCSDGRQEVPVENLVVVADPGRYKAEMVSPGQLFRGEPFRLECRLRLPEAASKAYIRFLMDGKVFSEGDFTEFRTNPRNPQERLFLMERKLPVTRTDGGREAQCEVRVPFGEPCCPRSAKLELKVEEPLHFETNKTMNRTVKSGQALTLTFRVRHWLPFNGSQISVINANEAEVKLVTGPEVTPISPHLSNVTLSFKPEEGTHYVALDRKRAITSSIRVAFASEKQIPSLKSDLDRSWIIVATALAVAIIVFLTLCYVCQLWCNKGKCPCFRTTLLKRILPTRPQEQSDRGDGYAPALLSVEESRV